MKNNRNSKKSDGKWLAAASVLGVAAVGAAILAAYNTTMSRLVPTNADADNNSSTNTWVFDAQTDDTSNTSNTSDTSEPVGNTLSGIPLDEETEAAQAITPMQTSEPVAEPEGTAPAEEVNKPITADIGNIMPVEGEISHPFSNGELVKSETLGVWKTHDGCDILCPLGTDVKSMSEGTVKEIKEDALWGVYVIVDQSNGMEAHYCGLAKELNVKAGQEIKQGELIGKTGDTCQVEIVQSPHLHLGVKQSGKWIDPMSVIDGAET